MADRFSPSSFQLSFLAPVRRDADSGEVYAQPPAVPRVVLVSARLATTRCGLGSEEWYDIEQDCADCDCACFTDDN